MGWGVNFSGKIPTIDKDTFGFSVLGGKGVGRYMNATQTTNADAVVTTSDIHTIPAAGGFANYTHHWTDLWQSNVMYSYVWNDNRKEQPDNAIHKVNYVLANLKWNPYPLVHVGVEYLYGTRKNNDGDFGQAHRITFGFIYLAFHKDPSLKNWWFGSAAATKWSCPIFVIGHLAFSSFPTSLIGNPGCVSIEWIPAIDCGGMTNQIPVTGRL